MIVGQIRWCWLSFSTQIRASTGEVFHFSSVWLWPNAGGVGSVSVPRLGPVLAKCFISRRCDCGPMPLVSAQFQYPDWGQYQLSVSILVGVIVAQCWLSFCNQCWTPCLIWAIIGPNRFGYLGMLWCRLEQWFSNLSWGPLTTAYFVCLPRLTHLIQLISSLVESARLEMGVAYERDIQNVWCLGVPRTGLRTTGLKQCFQTGPSSTTALHLLCLPNQTREINKICRAGVLEGEVWKPLV